MHEKGAFHENINKYRTEIWFNSLTAQLFSHMF